MKDFRGKRYWNKAKRVKKQETGSLRFRTFQILVGYFEFSDFLSESIEKHSETLSNLGVPSATVHQAAEALEAPGWKFRIEDRNKEDSGNKEQDLMLNFESKAPRHPDADQDRICSAHAVRFGWE